MRRSLRRSLGTSSLALTLTTLVGVAAAQPAPPPADPGPTGTEVPATPPDPEPPPEASPAPGQQAPTPALGESTSEPPPTGTPAPTAASVAPAEADSVTTPTRTAPPLPNPPAPARLAAADQGWLEIGGLLQFWAFRSSRDDAVTSTFRVRRAELKFSGEILPETLAYKVMVDPAKVLETRDTTVDVEGQEPEPTTPGSVTVAQPADKLSLFQDFAITYLSEFADVSVGQFKNGLSYEGFNSSSRLLLPERAPVSREYGDERDIGVSVEKDFEHFTYFVGVFNGTGLNLRDTNNQKDLAVRLELLPVEGLLFGAAGYTPLGERELPTTRDRVEADVRLDVANLVVQAEYLRGWDGPSDAQVTGHGFYGALGYTFLGNLQPVVRVGQLDTDLDANGSAGDDEFMHYDLGLNYYISGQNARLSASASVFDFEDEPTQTDIILMAQAAF